MSVLQDSALVTAYADGSLSGLRRSMEKAEISISLNLPLATSPDSVRGLNRWAQLNNNAPVYSLGSIHPECKNTDELACSIKDMGLKGIKMHPEYQEFNVLEKRLEKVWEACVKHDLFVLLHAGGDLRFPPPFRSRPSDFAELHKRFPKLRIVLAHLGSWKMWDETERELAGLPIYMDMAFTPGFLPDEKIMSIIKKHGADRILFGTDSPWRDQATEVKKVNSLPLSSTEKSMIFYKNAAKLLAID